MLDQPIEDLCRFLEVDSQWIDHVISKNYSCGCTSRTLLCEEWQAKKDFEYAEIYYKRAKERIESIKTKLEIGKTNA